LIAVQITVFQSLRQARVSISKLMRCPFGVGLLERGS